MEKTECHGNTAVTCPTGPFPHKSRKSQRKGVEKRVLLLDFETHAFCVKILRLHSFGQNGEEDNYGLRNLRDTFSFPVVVFYGNCPKEGL